MTTHTFQKISVLFSFYIVLYLYEDLRLGSKPTSCKMDHNLITIDLDKKCVLKKKEIKQRYHKNVNLISFIIPHSVVNVTGLIHQPQTAITFSVLSIIIGYFLYK